MHAHGAYPTVDQLRQRNDILPADTAQDHRPATLLRRIPQHHASRSSSRLPFYRPTIHAGGLHLAFGGARGLIAVLRGSIVGGVGAMVTGIRLDPTIALQMATASRPIESFGTGDAGVAERNRRIANGTLCTRNGQVGTMCCQMKLLLTRPTVDGQE